MKNTIITIVSSNKNKNLFGIVRDWANMHRRGNSIEFSVYRNTITVDIIAPKEQTELAIANLRMILA